MSEMTSRERLLRALSCDEGDHIPCCFMSFSALRKRHNEDMFALCKAELAMGLDSLLFIPAAGRPLRRNHPDLRGLPVRPAPEVETREWREVDDGDQDILHKEYITPAGTLSTSVRLSEDWTHGDHIPFIDDYQIPRQLKPLVTKASELPALDFMLTPPSEEDEAAFKQEAERAHAFVAEHGPLLVGGWGVGMDMANWLCGMQELMLLTFDEPDFVEDVLEMIHQWNLKRMELTLSAPVDLYIRRAWYEGVDFVVPDFYRDAILPRLKREVDLVHEHGAKCGYICSSGAMPLHDYHLEAGIDVLIGIDPVQGTYTEMPKVREELAGKVATWGGVSGAVTVELGEEEEVRAAVREAIDALGPDGFILSPVDNITVDRPLTWRNVDIFIDEWKKHR
jgi:uroporphyrinogen-III decarboxylase